jgi:hypothetical protein
LHWRTQETIIFPSLGLHPLRLTWQSMCQPKGCSITLQIVEEEGYTGRRNVKAHPNRADRGGDS